MTYADVMFKGYRTVFTEQAALRMVGEARKSERCPYYGKFDQELSSEDFERELSDFTEALRSAMAYQIKRN